MASLAPAPRRVLGPLVALGLTTLACAEPGHALLRHAESDLPGQLLRGTLEERAACVGVASPDTGWTVVLWPFASGATRSRDFVRVGMEDTSIRLGEAVALAGAFADPGTRFAADLDTRHIRTRCPAPRYFLVGSVVDHAPS